MNPLTHFGIRNGNQESAVKKIRTRTKNLRQLASLPAIPLEEVGAVFRPRLVQGKKGSMVPC